MILGAEAFLLNRLYWFLNAKSFMLISSNRRILSLREIMNKHYPGKDFHRFFIGEIVNCYSRKVE